MEFMDKSNLTKFIWRIENFSSIRDDSLQSPSFRSHSAEWSLEIYPSFHNRYIKLNLKQLDKQLVTINLSSVALIDLKGLPLAFSVRNGKICSGIINSSRSLDLVSINIEFRLVSRDSLLGSKQSKFLFKDTLTVECRIWEEANQHLTSLNCLAQTRFEPYPLKPLKKTIVLKVNDLSSLPSDQTVEHVEQNTWYGDCMKIRVAFSVENYLFAYLTVPLLTTHANFKVSVIDASMKRYEFVNVEFDFDGKTEGQRMVYTHITKFMLMIYKNEFLPNDVLSLEFQCALFFKVSFSRLVENEDNSTNAYTVNNTEGSVLPLTNRKAEVKKFEQDTESVNKTDKPIDVSQTLKNIFEEGFLADFSLKAGGKTFPVHKNILGARSSVFRAMFTADMKEKESGSVDIADMDADTLQRMLKFIYCDSVQEDMQWESVSSLYAAADRYALDPLKQKCRKILKSEMCLSSALGNLVLADTYQDDSMRSSALDFILEHDKEIIGNEDWDKFAEEHSKLAFDALQKVYLKKIDG